MTRYIDADALIQKMQRALDENNDTSAADTILRRVFKIIIGGLKETPTADVQEVKHGRFYLNELDDKWTCTVCGKSIYCYGIPSHKYCPHCGAIMDGKENDE
jgi:rubrerythrin